MTDFFKNIKIAHDGKDKSLGVKYWGLQGASWNSLNDTGWQSYRHARDRIYAANKTIYKILDWLRWI